jgi:hypothetical protein
VNCVSHGHLSAEQCRLDGRTESLRKALQEIADDVDRPNNSLEAQSGLLRIRLNAALMTQDQDALSSIWDDFGVALDKAGGLGEFDADNLTTLIEAAGQFAGNDPAYNALVEKLAEFVGARKSEGEGALILLRRAQKLGFEDHFDMIRWLGQATIGLTKREYTRPAIEAAQLLSLAYRSAGLPWASRSASIFAAASIIIEGESESEFAVDIVPTMKMWGWNALVLSHLPDFFFAVQLLRGCLAGLPLDETSKEKVKDDVAELDAALGCMFLNLPEAELSR